MAITGKANGLNRMMTICSHTDVLLPTKRPLLLFLYTYTATQEIIQYAKNMAIYILLLILIMLIFLLLTTYDHNYSKSIFRGRQCILLQPSVVFSSPLERNQDFPFPFQTIVHTLSLQYYRFCILGR